MSEAAGTPGAQPGQRKKRPAAGAAPLPAGQERPAAGAEPLPTRKRRPAGATPLPAGQGRPAAEPPAARAELETLPAAAAEPLSAQTELEALRTENARLRAAQAELVNAARVSSMGVLVAGIAHELNTPLGALRSNRDVLSRALARLQDILADEVVDESELADVRRIVAAVNGVVAVDEDALSRITSIVGSLRGYAEVGSSDVELLDVRAALDSALSLLAHERGAHVTVTRDYGDVPPVECVGGQLHQVFLNLLHNAFQAVGGRGSVIVRVQATPTEVLVTVEDTGPGIPPEYRERIFQGGFTTKGARVGMGLGLLITSQILQRHRGRIELRSEVGRGSSFLVHLPIGPARPDRRGRPDRPGRPGRPDRPDRPGRTEATPADPASPPQTTDGGPP